MSLDQRFAGFKAATPPDLWDEVEHRAGLSSGAELPVHLGTRRWTRAIGGTIAAALVAFLFLWPFLGLTHMHGDHLGPIGGRFIPGQIARYHVPMAQQLVFGGGAAWVAGSSGGETQEIWRVDAATGQTRELTNTRGAMWLAFGEGFAWVSCNGTTGDPCDGTAVLKLDPNTGATVARIDLSSRPDHIAVGWGAVFVLTRDGVVKIDPVSATVTQTMTGVQWPGQIGVSGGRVWVTLTNSVVEFDATMGSIVNRIPFKGACMLAAGGEGVFVSDCGAFGSKTLVRIDPNTGAVTYQAPLSNNLRGMMSLFAGRLWFGGWVGDRAEIVPLDPATGRPSGDPIVLPESSQPWVSHGPGPLPLIMAGGADSLWVTHIDTNDLIRVGIQASVSQLLLPAPRRCPLPIERGNSVPTDLIIQTMHGHVPSWLPPGFGLAGSWTDTRSSWATWTDDRCREVTVSYSPGRGGSQATTGPRVGAWTVSYSVAGACGNLILGSATCLAYETSSSTGWTGLQAMGVERDEGDRIVRSIPP